MMPVTTLKSSLADGQPLVSGRARVTEEENLLIKEQPQGHAVQPF